MTRLLRAIAIAALFMSLAIAVVGIPGSAAAQIDDICPTPTDPPVLDADDDGGIADLLDTTADLTAPDLTDDGLDDLIDNTADLTAPDLTDDGLDDLVDNTADLTAPDLTDDGLDDLVDNTADLTAPDLTDDGLDDLIDNTADLTAPGGSTTSDRLAFGAIQIEECSPCAITLTPVATATVEPSPTFPIPQFADFSQSDSFAQIVDCDSTTDDNDDSGGDSGSDTVTDLPKTGAGDAGSTQSGVMAGILLAIVLLIGASYDRQRRRG